MKFKSMFFFIPNMAIAKLNFILLFLTIGSIKQVKGQCTSPFSNGDVTSYCYYYDETFLSWSDSYNQCLNEAVNGILIEIYSIEQFNALRNLNIDNKGSFWLGANNFASFVDSQWHWLDGSIVKDSVITWCPNSTYETAIGTYCAAYDSDLNCVTNYLCSTLLPAPCVATTSQLSKQSKSILSARTSSSGACTNSYGGAYANWWTYSILLLNWFILFCFTLYVTNHFNLNKFAVILTIAIMIISFMIMVTFAVLWGVQYQNIIEIPIIVVVLGCAAGLLFLINILILVSNRNRVQRWMACMIASIITIIVEFGLMIGLILCIAYCSGYISLTSTSIDKDVIAALLASIATAVSIIFYNGIIHLIGYAGQDRVHAIRASNPNASIPLVAGQAIVPRRSLNNNGVNQRVAGGNYNKTERATSPVDQRILNEFYSDQPKGMHQYQLNGRQYVVYEGNSFGDVDPYRKDLTEAMLVQDPQGLRDSIARVKNSAHAVALDDEIRQAENLLNRLK